MRDLPENIEQVFALDVGDSVCDMHDGFPRWWPFGHGPFQQDPLVATTILQSACKDRGDRYLNKMMVVVAKYRDTVVLGYCYDGTRASFYYLQHSLIKS